MPPRVSFAAVSVRRRQPDSGTPERGHRSGGERNRVRLSGDLASPEGMLWKRSTEYTSMSTGIDAASYRRASSPPVANEGRRAVTSICHVKGPTVPLAGRR